MESRNSVRQLKFRLFTAALSVIVAFISLSSATYAWYISNNKVEGSATSISAEANGFMLQIVNYGDSLDHGSDQALYSAVNGHKISPASTDDLKSWCWKRYYRTIYTRRWRNILYSCGCCVYIIYINKYRNV